MNDVAWLAFGATAIGLLVVVIGGFLIWRVAQTPPPVGASNGAGDGKMAGIQFKNQERPKDIYPLW